MQRVMSLAVLVVLTVAGLLAGTLAGVSMPDHIEANGRTLVLNGLGLRTRLAAREYVAGLYLERPSGDANAILAADAPKRLVLHFLRDVDHAALAQTLADAFDANARVTLRLQIDQFTAALESLRAGEELAFTYEPGVGTRLEVKGEEKLTIPGAPFARALFGIWLGPNPPSAALKNGLLGR